MKDFYQNLNMNVLISMYFTDPDSRLTLKEGEVLMRQGGPNERLYLVLDGVLSGQVSGEDDDGLELFRVEPGMFAGVHSFFSRSFVSSTTMIALQKTTVAYIKKDQEALKNDANESLFEQFMPVVVGDLAYRQQLAHKMSLEKQQALQQLIEREKLASLGQMASGIAHELNNAASVLQRNTHWLSEQLQSIFSEENAYFNTFYEEGRKKGRSLSTREVRQYRKELQKRFDLSDSICRSLAETGIAIDMLPQSGEDLLRAAEKIALFWEIGATLYGMRLAADHAAHVATSVKTLGAPNSIRRIGEHVNESILQALTLLHHPLRQVTVKRTLAELPPISANKGELIQIWVNLIRNASESLRNSSVESPEITITTSLKNKQIVVRISDNGPGIKPELLPQIFQPNVTTKVSGLSFGLGLGLSIVQRLVESYGGRITVKSKVGKTNFEVMLPC